MGTEDSRADSLGLWAPVLWVVIQRPGCMPATEREGGIEQKAKVTPLRLHWWKVVTRDPWGAHLSGAALPQAEETVLSLP